MYCSNSYVYLLNSLTGYKNDKKKKHIPLQVTKLNKKQTKINQMKSLQLFESGASILESFFDSANSIQVALI